MNMNQSVDPVWILWTKTGPSNYGSGPDFQLSGTAPNKIVNRQFEYYDPERTSPNGFWARSQIDWHDYEPKPWTVGLV